MTDTTLPRKSVAAYIAGLQILAKYMKAGLNQKFFCSGVHDVICIHVDADKCPEESPDGVLLISYGFHVGDYGWEYFT